MRSAVAVTVAERTKRYGDFANKAKIADGLISVMSASPQWPKLPAYMRVALIWIAEKIARILNGDATYRDNWHDIAGYASLVERELPSDGA